MRNIRIALCLVGALSLGGLAHADDWADNFDSYANGTVLSGGLGGWTGWDNTPSAAGIVSNAQSNSAPNSLDSSGGVDAIQEHNALGATSGVWVYKTMTYVATGHTGVNYFILLNTYNAPGVKNWSLQLRFNGTTGMLEDEVSTSSVTSLAPLIFDQWVRLTVVIDLDNNLQHIYYDDVFMLTKSWTEGVSGGGALNIGATDLFANSATSVFYDDMSLCLASPDLVITEVCDGTLMSGGPKFMEITNTGSSTISNLAVYSIGNFNNGSTTLGGGGSTMLNPVSLAPGASYIFDYESSTNTNCDPGATLGCFELTYGFAPDQFAGGGFINGDDALALFIGPASGDATGAVLHDVYGVPGVDGTGEVWEHTDGYSFRCGKAASSTFNPLDWCFGGVDSLQTGNDPDELTLIQLLTNPGVYVPGCAPRTFCTAKTNSCGGTPAISSVGNASASNVSPFTVSGSNANTGKLGLVIYGANGLMHPAVPFSPNQAATINGFLCVELPVSRTVILANAGGTGVCDGTFSIDMNDFAAGNLGGSPASFLASPGTLVYAQWWGRDNWFHGEYLTDTLEYCVGP